MMKLLRSCISSYNGIFRVSKVVLYSTQTLASTTSAKDTLYKRISPAGNPEVSIVPILDQWIQEGRSVTRDELKTILKLLRKYNRYTHALQLSEWMSDRRYVDLSPGDAAIRLDLVSRVHGLEQAEKYFNRIPETLRTFQVYGALLNCYAHKKCLEKADNIMQKMRQLGFLRTLSYNVMLNLYYKMGKHEKLDTVIQEMEEMGVSCDKSTFYIRLNAYASAPDIDGMEMLLKKMEGNPSLTLDWNAYISAANGYLKAGLVEKTLAMLNRSEQLISGKTRGFAYEILLTLYARMGKKYEVYRVWTLYRKMGKIYNSGYSHMISSLIKLDDIDGAEKIMAEWESQRTSFDFRIPNVLINAYCRKGLSEKAEAFLSRLIESGKQPPASTWDCLATSYHKDNQMENAVETMKKAIFAYQRDWKLNRVTLTACLEYLKEKGDVDVAEEFESLLRERGHLSHISSSTTDSVKTENFGSHTLDAMEGNDEDLDEETRGVMG